MATVVFGPRPPELETWLGRRRELGQDRYDEVWGGDYHVGPGYSTIGHPVVVRLAEIEGCGDRQASLLGSRPKETRQLAVHEGVLGRGARHHVVVPLPHLVVAVLAELPPPAEPRLELRRARAEHYCRHPISVPGSHHPYAVFGSVIGPTNVAVRAVVVLPASGTSRSRVTLNTDEIGRCLLY